MDISDTSSELWRQSVEDFLKTDSLFYSISVIFLLKNKKNLIYFSIFSTGDWAQESWLRDAFDQLQQDASF